MELRERLIGVGQRIMEEAEKYPEIVKEEQEGLADLSMVVELLKEHKMIPEGLMPAYERLKRTTDSTNNRKILIKTFPEFSAVARENLLGCLNGTVLQILEDPADIPEGALASLTSLLDCVQGWKDGPLYVTPDAYVSLTLLLDAVEEVDRIFKEK